MNVTSLSLLERLVFDATEAAAYLGLRGDRVRAWLDGCERARVRYPPVGRHESTGSDVVTWGEFVELGISASTGGRAAPCSGSGRSSRVCAASSARRTRWRRPERSSWARS